MVQFSGRRSPADENLRNSATELNVAVINAADAGHSSSLNQIFDLSAESPFSNKPNLYTLHGIHYAVRFSKHLARDLRYNDAAYIRWPRPSRSAPPLSVHAVVLVYEVIRADALLCVPRILDSLKQSAIPAVLVPSRSVQFASTRTRQRDAIEERAKSLCDGVDVFHMVESPSELQKKCVSALLVRHVRGPEVSGANQHVTRRYDFSRDQEENPSSYARMGTESSHSAHETANPYPSSSNRSSDSSFASLDVRRKMLDMDLGNDTDPSSVASSPSYNPGYTLEDLVSRLLKAPFTIAEDNFVANFLAVYRMFAAPSQLLRSILSQCQFGSRQSVEDDSMSPRKYSVDRCLVVIDQWIQTYPGDFAHPLTGTLLQQFLIGIASAGTQSTVRERIGEKLAGVQPDSDTDWAISDGSSVHEGTTNSKAASDDSMSSSSRHSMYATPALLALRPHPRRPLSNVQWQYFMDQDEDHVAQELVYMSHSLFQALPLRDLLRHATSSASGTRSTSPLAALTIHFNHIAHWTSNIILTPPRSKYRSLTLAKMMRVARKVRQQNDYNTLGAIIAGIQATSVHRLRQTWDLVSAEQRKDCLKLEVLLASARGFASYRLAWENTNAGTGRVPFLAVHQRDLVVAVAGGKTYVDIPSLSGSENHAEVGASESQPPSVNTSFHTQSSTPSTANTSFTSHTTNSSSSTSSALPARRTSALPRRMINWRKFEIIGATLISLRAAQTTPYAFLQQNDSVRSLVLESTIAKEEEDLYTRSCALEPPEQAPNTSSTRAGAQSPTDTVKNWMGKLGKKGTSDRRSEVK